MFYPIPIPRIASKQAFCKFNFPNSIPLKLYLIVTNYDIITPRYVVQSAAVFSSNASSYVKIMTNEAKHERSTHHWERERDRVRERERKSKRLCIIFSTLLSKIWSKWWAKFISVRMTSLLPTSCDFQSNLPDPNEAVIEMVVYT